MKTLLYIGNDFQFSPMEGLGKRLSSHFKIHFASSKINKLHRLLEMCLAVWKYRKQADFVLIDTYSSLNFWYAWSISLLCRALGKPYITYLHGGNLPNRLMSAPRMSAAIFRHSHENIAPSGYLQAAFEQQGYKTRVIPNFIDIENYPFVLRKKPQARLLWVRSFDKVYNPEMTIHVFAAIHQLYPKAQLCMVGPEKDGSMANCQALVKKLSLEQQVTFTGSLTKPTWIALAADYDIFISSTNIDNTPVSLIEAMAIGLPVVSTDVGGVPYLIDHGKDGLLSPPNDIAAMVANIKTLIQQAHVAESISRNARHKVVQFDWKVIEKQWLSLLS